MIQSAIGKRAKRTSIFLNTKGGKAWTVGLLEPGAGGAVSFRYFAVLEAKSSPEVLYVTTGPPPSLCDGVLHGHFLGIKMQH